MSNPISKTNLSASNIDQIFTDTITQLENIKNTIREEGVPDTKNAPAASNPELPSLPLPLSSLPLETLLNVIGIEQRKATCKAGIESIKAKAQLQQSANEEQLQEINKQIEKMEKQKVVNKFKKIFGFLGAIIGAIASAVTIAVGVVTANPLLVTAGAVGMAMAVDSAVSLATNGKVSLMAGFAKLGQALGMSEETAQKFAMGMQLALTAVTVALSFGAGFASVASSADTIINVANTAQKVLNIANGVLTTAQGATTIANSIIQYQVDQSKITQKELQAILERIRQAIEMEKDIVESEMQRSNDLLEQVHDIIKNDRNTQHAIITGTPNFA